jgi:hypothetical protein
MAMTAFALALCALAAVANPIGALVAPAAQLRVPATRRPFSTPAVGSGVTDVGTVSIDLDRPLARFRPDRALGAGVDGHGQGEIRQIYTRRNLRAMHAAGFGPLTYRLRTELGVEAWHWNRYGTWSDPAHHQGYWTGSARPGPAFAATYGYRLPRRGDTIDQANNDGYSRLDDGSTRTFWKSNPYLDPHFTHEADAIHPQWVLVDLGRLTPIDAIRIAWAQPYARRLRVQYFVGGNALQFANNPSGHWLPFHRSLFGGRGGIQTLRVETTPRRVGYVRVLMYRSSHTVLPGSTDVRDRLGFAVRELYVGTLQGDRLRDVVRHARRGSRQTVTYVSSTDPWHRASDRDPNTEQPSFQTVLHSGLMNRTPLLTPVPTLYGTPDDAAAELRYLRALHVPVRRMELGEEPDGQLVTPEDYGSLYVQFARRLHRIDPRLQLGGPGYQTSIPDWMSWPLRPGGDVSWTRRFLEELGRLKARRDLSFFSFEWYPFDKGCLPPAPQLARAPELLTNVINAQHAEGLPAKVPMLITEYGFSAFAGRDMVEMPGALLNADTVGSFLADGGSTAYLYGLEPDALINELNCHSWGNLILWLSDYARRIIQPVATFWAARMLTREWVQPGDGLNTMLAADATPTNAFGHPLVTAYAVRRPDHRLALMLINKDPQRSWLLTLHLRHGSTELDARGRLEVITLSSAQYRWHAIGDHGYARPDRPPTRTSQPAAQPLRLAPMSLTVVRLSP